MIAPAAERELGTAGDRQQPPGRRQHDRHRRRRQGRARRPYAAGHHVRVRDQLQPAEAALRPGEGFHGDHRNLVDPADAGGASLAAGANVKEFIDYSKAQPAGLDYATSGAGTSTHLAAEMFKTMTGAKLVHVPFKGNAEVHERTARRPREGAFRLSASTLQHVRSGALRVLAVTTEKRLADLPDVPTIAELGYPGYEISSWQGVFAPAGTPKDIIAQAQRRDRRACSARRRSRRASSAKAPIRSAARPSNSPRAFQRGGEVGEGRQVRRAWARELAGPYESQTHLAGRDVMHRGGDLQLFAVDQRLEDGAALGEARRGQAGVRFSDLLHQRVIVRVAAAVGLAATWRAPAGSS